VGLLSAGFFFRRWKIIGYRNFRAKNQVRINDMIKIQEIRVVDEDGSQLGVMTNTEALAIAEEKGLDLVEIAPNAKPPVCKIIDYGKFKYEQSKKAKRAKKKQHITHLKEIKLSTKIESHDLEFKMKHAEKFILNRDKVKFTVKFRGREMQHQEMGFKILEDIKEKFKEIAVVEKEPVKMGRTLSMTLVGHSSKKIIEKGEDDAEDKNEQRSSEEIQADEERKD
jgi:translation initiation factor IF-3